MNALPRAARWYLYVVWGTAALLVASTLARTASAPHPLLLAAALVAFVLADYFIVEYRTNDGKQIGMTITDSLVIFLASTVGAQGVLVVIAGSLFTDILGRRGWFKGLFNAAQRSINYVVLLAIFTVVSTPDAPPFTGPRGLVAFALMASAYHALNTVLVATIVALAGGQQLIAVYVESFRRVHWVHFITLPFGAALSYIWATNPWLVIPAALPLVMAQRSFQAMAEIQEQSRSNQELARRATQLLEELQTKQEELVRSSKLAALGTLSAGIGHEFNNLLTAILGNAQLGLSTDDVREKDEALEVMLQASMRGRGITGGLLNFARRSDPKRAPANLAAVVRETVALAQPEFSRLGIQVEQVVEPVPTLVCDAGQIAQVLMNLLTNARDAMSGGDGGTVRVALRERLGFVELAVGDSGAGIPDELLPHIFQPFMTTKAATEGGERGTGLGLAISARIVESHGGTIAVDSQVGKGTTMTVRLPISDSAAPARADEPAPLEFRAVG
jgi:signal transduction histidine kinase